MFNNFSSSRAAGDLLPDVSDGVFVTMPVKMLSLDARPDVAIDAVVGMLTGTMTSLEAMTVPA